MIQNHIKITMFLSKISFCWDKPVSLALGPSDYDSPGTTRCSPLQPTQLCQHLPPAVPNQHPQIWPPGHYRHMWWQVPS